MGADRSASVKSLKAGVWYTVSKFMIKGLVFITTPIFARLLTKTEFGSYSNFTSWLSIMAIVATLHMESATGRARYDFEKEFDEYISSVAFFGSIVTLGFYITAMLFMPMVSAMTSLDPKYIHVIFISLLFAPSYDMLQIKNRYEYRYKLFVAISILIAVSSTLTAVYCVNTWEDALAGRIFGSNVPEIIIYFVSFLVIMSRGKNVLRTDCWKYAALYSVPMIPHLLSNVILGSSDKIMITRMVGAEANATYSLAYSCGMIISTLVTSANQAMVPWLFDRLHSEDYPVVKKATRIYLTVFALIIESCILLAPELSWILGGEKYADAKYLIAPVMLGYGFKLAYTTYVNVEQYEKKTSMVSIGTMTAALFNVAANLVCIPLFGYQAASYTTLAGFALLLVMHYGMSRKQGMVYMYDNRFTMALMGVTTLAGLASQTLYTFMVPRYILVAVLGAAMIYIFLKLAAYIRK